MVRCGIGLYGFGNSAKEDATFNSYCHLKIRYFSNSYIEKGETVGYNRALSANRIEKTATIPIGHADGIGRQFWQRKGFVTINNKKAPIIGNVCMDMIMVNVTDIDCDEGDEVIIFGNTYQGHRTFARIQPTLFRMKYLQPYHNELNAFILK